jgi:excisionase family DNA binding protein
VSIRRTINAQPYTLDEILGIDFDRLRAGSAPAADDRRDECGAPADRTWVSATAFNPDVDHRIDELGCSVPATFDGDGNPETIPSPPFLSLTEAAAWLGISLSTVKRLVDRRELAAVRIGARRKIPLSELKNYALARLVGRSMPIRKLQGNAEVSAKPAKTSGD